MQSDIGTGLTRIQGETVLGFVPPGIRLIAEKGGLYFLYAEQWRPGSESPVPGTWRITEKGGLYFLSARRNEAIHIRRRLQLFQS